MLNKSKYPSAVMTFAAIYKIGNKVSLACIRNIGQDRCGQFKISVIRLRQNTWMSSAMDFKDVLNSNGHFLP